MKKQTKSNIRVSPHSKLRFTCFCLSAVCVIPSRASPAKHGHASCENSQAARETNGRDPEVGSGRSAPAGFDGHWGTNQQSRPVPRNRFSKAAALPHRPSGTTCLDDNGGFETGDFTGWTQGGDLSFTSVSTTMPHSGTFFYEAGPLTEGTLDQAIATTAGKTYTVDFWLANTDTANNNDFSASFAGVPILSLTNAGLFSVYPLYDGYHGHWRQQRSAFRGLSQCCSILVFWMICVSLPAAAATPTPTPTATPTCPPGNPNGGAGVWTAQAPYPTTIVRYGFVQTATDFYVFGGVSDGAEVNNVNSYNIASGTWTPRSPMPFTSEAPTCSLDTSSGIAYCAQGRHWQWLRILQHRHRYLDVTG